MKKKILFRLKNIALIILPLFMLSALLITSCEKKPVVENPVFNIEGDPTGLSVSKAAKTQSYVVRSNKSWEIVKKENADWVKAWPEKGDADGIFKIIVSANETFDARTVNFAFVVDGTEQPVLFRVDQTGNVPYITLPAEVTIPAAGGDLTVDVTSNVAWSYSLSNGSWLTEKSVTANSITLTANENTSVDPRNVTLTVTATNYPSVVSTVTMTQSPGTVVLEEDFSWLAYGNVVFYTTGGETRYDLWKQEEKDKGWYSTPLPESSNQQFVYARPGFVKLGKTGVGGDLISPALSKIVGTVDVQVTFKAIPYMTATGTMDDNLLNVSVIGPGTVSQSDFVIDNWPAYPADAGAATDYCIGMWSAPEATRTFTITGATSETKIKFLGGDYALVGVGAGKNRIFLDDIKVEIIL